MQLMKVTSVFHLLFNMRHEAARPAQHLVIPRRCGENKRVRVPLPALRHDTISWACERSFSCIEQALGRLYVLNPGRCFSTRLCRSLRCQQLLLHAHRLRPRSQQTCEMCNAARSTQQGSDAARYGSAGVSVLLRVVCFSALCMFSSRWHDLQHPSESATAVATRLK